MLYFVIFFVHADVTLVCLVDMCDKLYIPCDFVVNKLYLKHISGLLECTFHMNSKLLCFSIVLLFFRNFM